MQLDTAELLERLTRLRAEIGAIEKLLREAGATKAEARKICDMQETLTELEVQLNGREEVRT